MKRPLACLLVIGLIAGSSPLRAAEDEESPGIFASYEAWATSEAGKAAVAELEKRFWGDEENEAFVNKLIDWGNTKKLPNSNAKLGKVIFLSDSEFKAKVAEQISAFGSIEKIWSTLEIVDRISAGEWAEVMQEAVTGFLTEAATDAVPVLGQLKLAYDIAKIGWDAFMGEIYDLNVQQLYKIYSREKMDWPTFQDRFQAQLGYGDAAMDQFTREFAGKNGYAGLTKDDFISFKKGDNQATRTIDTITRILYNKFKEQRQKELNAAAQAKAAKKPLEDAAWVLSYEKNRAQIRAAVAAEMKKRAIVEFEKNKALIEKGVRWRAKEKAMAVEAAKARAAAGPEPTVVPVEIPFSGMNVPDPRQLIETLDRIIASGGIPAGGMSPHAEMIGERGFTRYIWPREDSKGIVIRDPEGKVDVAGQGAIRDFLQQLFELENAFYPELAKALEAIDKQQQEQRKSYDQRLDALDRIKASCEQAAYSSRMTDGMWQLKYQDCSLPYRSAKDALDKSMGTIFASLNKQIEKLPRLDLEPVFKRYQHWTERYGKLDAAASAAAGASSELWFYVPSPAKIDTRGSFTDDYGQTIIMQIPVEYHDPVEEYAKPRLADAKAQIRQACAEGSWSVVRCAEVLRAMAEGPLNFSLSDQAVVEESEDNNLVDFRKTVAKATAARPRAESACRGLFAAAEGTAWARDMRGSCSAALATFNNRLNLAAEWERQQLEKFGERGALREREAVAVAMVQEFRAEVEAAQPIIEGAAELPVFSSERHPFDWLRQAGETGALSMTYLPGLDEKELSAIRSQVSGVLGGFSGWLQEYAATPYTFFSNLQAVLKTIKPVPKDAFVYNDSLVAVADMRDISSSANLIDPAGRHAVNQAVSLRNSLQSFVPSARDIPENHPLRAAYESARGAIDAAEARIEKSSADRVKAAQKKGRTLLAAIAKLKDAAAKEKASLAEVARLRKELDALQKELDGLSGKERDETGVDTQALMQGLLECESAIQETSHAKMQDDALDKLRDIEERMAAAPAGSIQALLIEAAKVAQTAGIGGKPEVVELMRRLQSPPLPGAPPGGKAEGPEVKAMRDALDDFQELSRKLAALPGGAASESRIEELVEQGQGLLERAVEKLPNDASGRPNPNKKPVEEELERFKKAAELKKTALPAPASHALGVDQQAVAAIQTLYQRFAAAFAAKDLAAVLDCLAEDWEAAEGTSLSDMESTLSNSFSAFDSITMEIQNLQIRPAGNGAYTASYGTHMVGTIRQNDISHEEKSTHQDSVVFLKGTPRILRTTGSTGWVQ